jgi:hypothetical protein
MVRWIGLGSWLVLSSALSVGGLDGYVVSKRQEKFCYKE